MKHLKSLITLEAVSRTLMPISVNTNFGPIEKNLVLAVVVARFALCFSQAATQSLTLDEAFTYLQIASGPWENWHGPFDANNHVRYTLLERLSVVIFGTSALSIRLPSLFGGLLFSVGVSSPLLLRFCQLVWDWLLLPIDAVHLLPKNHKLQPGTVWV